MKNNASFDDHIREQLADYKPEVPPHIWENIMAGKKKTKPAGLLFYFNSARSRLIMLVFIIAAASALLVRQAYKRDPVKEASANKKNESTKIRTGGLNSISESAGSENTGHTMKANDQPQLPRFIGSSTDKATVYQPADYPLSITVSNKKELKDKPAMFSIARTANKKKKGAAYGMAVDKKTNVPGISYAKYGNRTARSAARSRMVIEDPGAEASPLAEEITAGAGTAAMNDQISLERYFLHLHAVPVEKTFSYAVKNISLSALNIPCPGLEKNAAGNKRYFEIYGGPDYAFRSFNDTAHSAYLQKRKESTRFSSAFSLGIRYTKVFDNAVSFRAGINYSQVNERFRFEQGHIVQLVYLIDEHGDTTGSYATTGSRYKTTHNRYRTIDIPVLIGYEMGNGRFHTNVNAGLVMNVYSWQHGDLLDSALQPINITTGKANSPYQFKTNVGIGFMGGVSFYYKLTNSLHMLAEPYFRYNFSAANKADITLKQKYTTAGLRVGLRIDF